MTPLKFASKIRKDTKQSVMSLPDADILLLANPIKDSIAELIAGRDLKGNYFIIPTLFDFVAGQREYAQPDDVLDHIFSIEVAFTATLDSFSQTQFVKALPDDFSKWNVSRTEANIQAHYANAKGMVGYEIQRRCVYLLSGAIDSTTLGGLTVPNGINLRYRSYPADLATLTDDTTDMSIDPTTITFGMPRQFHELWARACAIEWKAQHPGAVPATTLEGTYAEDLELKLQAMNNPDLEGETLGRIPYDDGSDL